MRGVLTYFEGNIRLGVDGAVGTSPYTLVVYAACAAMNLRPYCETNLELYNKLLFFSVAEPQVVRDYNYTAI